MHMITPGSLVEILSRPSHDSILGLVLETAEVSGKHFFHVRYTEAGCSDTRWISEKFIKRY